MNWFNFIDKFYNDSDKKAFGKKSLNGSEKIFIDHFPNKPMLPAAMMVDASVNLMLYWSWSISNYKNTAIANGFDKFVFYNSVFPGQTFDILIECESGICVTEAWNTDTKQSIYKGQIYYRTYSFDDFHDMEYAKSLINNIYSRFK